MKPKRSSQPRDVSDEEWSSCVPYLTLMNEHPPQSECALRDIFDALRWLVRAGCPWQMMPNDLPPWSVVYQQTRRWSRAGCFEARAHDLRGVLRLAQERNEERRGVILDSRTLQSTPQSGGRAGFDGHEKWKGSKVHAVVDTLGHLLALRVTPANEQDRAQLADFAQAVQAVTEDTVEVAFVDQGYTGTDPAQAAANARILLKVVKHHEAKSGFVLLPRSWVVERSFAWAASLSTPGSRLRALGRITGWLSLAGLCDDHAENRVRQKSTTGSRH